MRIDGLQYAKYSRTIFEQMREGSVDAVHVTIAYEQYPDLIMKGTTAADIDAARASNRTAIFFGFQNPSPIEDDIGLVEVLHTLGARFMQLTYNNQSLLATGCYEDEDPGITRMGKQVIKEMNRVGLVVDMSHSSDRSTIEAAELSSRPIVISHANPYSWMPARRNKRDEVIQAVVDGGGMLGFSMYPHHLHDKSDCTLDSFCEMIARTADQFGVKHLGIGSDLCQDQPDSVVEWMRVGRWSKELDYGEGSADNPGFPPMPPWFKDNRDFGNIETGLRKVGMSNDDVASVMGGNWYRFFAENFHGLATSA